MRDFAKISPKFWNGKVGKALKRAGPEAVVVALYLKTCQHSNMLGLYFLSKTYVAVDTGLGMDVVERALRSACDAGFCLYDEETEMVWVPDMAAEQIAESLEPADNRVKGIQKEYDNLPDNPFLAPFYARYAAAFHMKRGRGGASPPLQSPSEASSTPLWRPLEAPPKPLQSPFGAPSEPLLDYQNQPQAVSTVTGDVPHQPLETTASPSEAPSKPLPSPSQAPPKQGEGEGEVEVEGEGETFATRASPGSRTKRPKTGKPEITESPTAGIWAAYSSAYLRRYSVEPVRNAKVNGQLKQVVDRLGAEEAAHVAEFYVGLRDNRYTRAMHSVDLLLHDCEQLRTQWATGHKPPMTEFERQSLSAALLTGAMRVSEPETIDVESRIIPF